MSFVISKNIISNIKGLRHWVSEILGLENHSLWQRLNSFSKNDVNSEHIVTVFTH